MSRALVAAARPAAAAPGFLLRLISSSRFEAILEPRVPQTHQEDGSGSNVSKEAFELRPAGVPGTLEPGVPHPGTSLPPEGSVKPAPIAKVTHDGDVIMGPNPDAPGSSQPRN